MISEKNKQWALSMGKKSIIICNNCGWLVTNLREIDTYCPDCRKSYDKTNSKEEYLR